MAPPEPHVVVVGSVNRDLVVRLERLPGPGETVSGGELSRHGGGKGANQAVAVVRAGARASLVAAVGADPEGDEAIAELEGAGVDARWVRRSSTAATGVALIAVDREGNNQIAVAPGANREGGEIDPAVFGGAPGVALLSFEAPDRALVEAAGLAAAAGWMLVANPAPVRPLPDGLLAARPILVPNEHEARELTGVDEPEEAARILQARSGAPVVITLGARGALLLEGGALSRLPAPAVHAVDTTGAGDALCGTLAARLAAGDGLSHALAAAVDAASESTTRPGAR
jgi:ribokinase